MHFDVVKFNTILNKSIEIILKKGLFFTDLEVVGAFKYIYFSLLQNLLLESNKFSDMSSFGFPPPSYEIHTLNKQYQNSNNFDLSWNFSYYMKDQTSKIVFIPTVWMWFQILVLAISSCPSTFK